MIVRFAGSENPRFPHVFGDCKALLEASHHVRRVRPLCESRALAVFLNRDTDRNQESSATQKRRREPKIDLFGNDPAEAVHGLLMVAGIDTKEHPLRELSRKHQLDLHGKIPIEVKFAWVDRFIERAFKEGIPMVDIITGRGLHNPKGKMGELWRMCRCHLLHRNLSDSIQEIRSIARNGGWRVVLKTPRV